MQIAHDSAHIPLREVLQRLGEMEITSLLLEGGAEVHTTALKQGLVDKLMLFYAPKFLGQTAVPMVGSSEGLPPIHEYALKQIRRGFCVRSLSAQSMVGTN